MYTHLYLSGTIDGFIIKGVVLISGGVLSERSHCTYYRVIVTPSVCTLYVAVNRIVELNKGALLPNYLSYYSTIVFLAVTLYSSS